MNQKLPKLYVKKIKEKPSIQKQKKLKEKLLD